MEKIAIICMSMLLTITIICACLNISLAQTSNTAQKSPQEAFEKIRTKLHLAIKEK